MRKYFLAACTAYECDKSGNMERDRWTGQTGFEFTGKKRDGETNLDYLHDRYLIPGIPHFLQPDRGPWIYTNVKTLNRYQANYQNYPRFFDYDGKEVSSTGGGFSIRGIFNKIFQMDMGMTTDQAVDNVKSKAVVVAKEKVAEGKDLAVQLNESKEFQAAKLGVTYVVKQGTKLGGTVFGFWLDPPFELWDSYIGDPNNPGGPE